MNLDLQLVEDFFQRHAYGRVMLQFSAGKDSAATLWALRDYWLEMDVVWINPGNPYPETVEYMERIASIVPRFQCVLGNQPANIMRKGWPVDILPMETTQLGLEAHRKSGIMLRPFWDCCGDNMWKPMADWVKHGNYSGVIRGQKSCDSMQNRSITSGTVVEGVEYLLPIEHWTDKEVIDFLGPDRLPESYKRGLRSSLDCMNCTAYTAENPGRVADLERIDADSHRDVAVVHLYLLNAISAHTEALRSCHANPTTSI